MLFQSLYRFLFRISWLPALLWAALILYLSGANPDSLPSPNILEFDKLAHLSFYAVFCGLLFVYFKRKAHPKGKAIAFATLTAFAYGIIMELCQYAFFPKRTFDLYDATANGVGCLLFSLAAFYIYPKDEKSKAPNTH